MATPKKKHLIELMIEAGIKWPEGALYAAQDKRDSRVYFFHMKPYVATGDKHFCASGGTTSDSYLLPDLCRNWNRTIVTREQYAEAVLMQEITGSDKQEQQTHSGEAGVMPTESIELLLAEIKAKREEHSELVTKANTLTIEIANIEQRVNDTLNKYGFVMYQITTPSAAVNTPQKIGDKCIVTDAPDSQSWVGLECVLCDIDENFQYIQYLIKQQEKGRCWIRDICRP